jgi:hypothetical protein
MNGCGELVDEVAANDGRTYPVARFLSIRLTMPHDRILTQM